MINNEQYMRMAGLESAVKVLISDDPESEWDIDSVLDLAETFAEYIRFGVVPL